MMKKTTRTLNVGNDETSLTSTQKDLLQKTSVSHLIEFFHRKFPSDESSEQSFAKSNALKPDLFYSFLYKGEKYVSGRFCLFKLYALEQINWEIKSKDYNRFLYDYNIALNLEDIRKRIVENIARTGFQRKVILFIDGDNLSHELSLGELVEQYKKHNTLLHVIIVFANGVVNDAIMGYETLDWISITHSITNTKDAADTCISMAIGSLHASLRAFFPTSNHAFVVVTKDHFFEELTKQCILIGRPCFSAKNINDCVTILNKFKSNENIEVPVEQKIINLKGKGVQVTKIVAKPKSKDLKELFQVAWLGEGKSQNQFCKTYNLDSTNFSKHMNNKKYNHACKLKLEEFYKSYKTSTKEISHFVLNIEGYLKEIDIEHEISGNSITLTDLGDFSFTTPHHYNPLFKEGYPVLYEEWLDYNNNYRAEFYKLTHNEKRFSCKLCESIVTLPLRMDHPHDKQNFVPIDIELRIEKGGNSEVSIYLRPPIGQFSEIIFSHFSFKYWTPQEFISESKNLSSKLIDNSELFLENGKIPEPETGSVSIVKGNFPNSNPNQRFFPINQIDLTQIKSLDDLIGKKCTFIKSGDVYILDTRGSLPIGLPAHKMVLVKSVVDYVTKRDSPIEVEGIIDSIEHVENVYVVGCKVL